MNIEILESSKDAVSLKIDNLTVAEVLRVYLNKEGVKLAAWRREHPDKPLLMRIEASSGTVKKAVNDAISAINRDLDGIVKSFKK